MKGKREFSEFEAIQIRILINQKVLANENDQKGIRKKIRDLKFWFSEFSNKKGYNVEDFERLIKAGKIIITSKENRNYTSKKNSNTDYFAPITELVRKEIQDNNIENSLIVEGDFRNFADLDPEILKSSGLYCIRLKQHSRLPERYQNVLDKRKYKLIYIGKAEGQILRERLSQEIEHKKPGTFFRSIGSVLKYLPMKGHLKGKSNQKNFRFSKDDTAEIVKWLKANVEISIAKHESSFEIEHEFIRKYCPLLNDTHNPLRLQELIDDKAECRKIARGN